MKKINVIDKETKIVMRVNKLLADNLVKNGTHTRTSKSKLKSFLNKEAKLHRNKRAIKQFGTKGGQWRDPINGKIYTNLVTFKIMSPFQKLFSKNKGPKGRYKNWDRENIEIEYDEQGKLINDFESSKVEETGIARIVTKFAD